MSPTMPGASARDRVGKASDIRYHLHGGLRHRVRDLHGTPSAAAHLPSGNRRARFPLEARKARAVHVLVRLDAQLTGGCADPGMARDTRAGAMVATGDRIWIDRRGGLSGPLHARTLRL